MTPHLLVLPSPFLGSAVYEPAVAALVRAGVPASVAPSGPHPDAHRLIADWTDVASGHDRVVLVAHSNAGYLAPAVGTARSVRGIVFVDAALPGAPPVTRLAPPPLRSFLAGLADADGLLPRWTQWWPREAVAGLLPAASLEELDQALPAVPLDYVDAEVPVPPGWEQGARAYLAFGSTYAEEWDRAGSEGWLRRRLGDAGHLHLLAEADQTAAVVVALVGELTARP